MHCEICFDMERTTELLVLWAFVILNGFTLMCVVCILFIMQARHKKLSNKVKQLSSFQASLLLAHVTSRNPLSPPPPPYGKRETKAGKISVPKSKLYKGLSSHGFFQ